MHYFEQLNDARNTIITIYLNHKSLLVDISLKITSFRVCSSTALSFTYKKLSTFSVLHSSGSKGNSGLYEAAELYGRNSHHEGVTFTNVLQIAENQIKGVSAKYFWIMFSLWTKLFLSF